MVFRFGKINHIYYICFKTLQDRTSIGVYRIVFEKIFFERFIEKAFTKDSS